MKRLLPLVFVSLLSCGGGQSLSPSAAQSDTTLAAPRASLPVTPVSDEVLANRLREVFATIEDFQNITVSVQNGVVGLSGTALGPAVRERAAELAAQFEGVLYVDNRITEETDIETRLTPALTKIQDYLDRAVALLPIIAVALALIILFWLLSRLLTLWEAPYRRLGINPLLRGLIRQLIRTVILLIGVLLALDILGATALVGAVLGTAGVAGIAIGFAFRDIVENYLAGALLSLRQPFAINDLIEIGEVEGKVIRLTSRELVLMTLDGNHVRIPNATVFTSVITNYTRNPRRLFKFAVGVDVEEDLVYVQRLGTEALRAMNGVMRDPEPFARVEELGDYNVIIGFFGWVDQRQADFFKVRSQALRIVKAALDEANVLMPEPITNVRLERVESLRVGAPAQATAQGEKPAPDTLPTIRAEAKAVEVSVDRQLDAQIQEDLAVSDEPNLLEGGV